MKGTAQTSPQKGFPEIIADDFPEATILFAGLHDFSRLTERMAGSEGGGHPAQQNLFGVSDVIVQKLGLEKIKITGESYMIAAAGDARAVRPTTPKPSPKPALALQQEILALHDAPNEETFSLRVGINTGPVVAGVIGKTKFSYDVLVGRETGEHTSLAHGNLWRSRAYTGPATKADLLQAARQIPVSKSAASST